MTVIIKNANLNCLEKVQKAVEEWQKIYGKHERITVDYLGGNGFNVYSKGTKDQMLINAR